MKKPLLPSNAAFLNKLEKHGIESDINVRWEKGTDHHPKSLELMKGLETIDFELCNDYFEWKVGGDGDNGETFMYEMDIYFELQDKLKDNNNG